MDSIETSVFSEISQKVAYRLWKQSKICYNKFIVQVYPERLDQKAGTQTGRISGLDEGGYADECDCFETEIPAEWG